MKGMKVLKKSFLPLSLSLLTLGAWAQDRSISFAELPRTAQAFIENHYDPGQVSHIVLDDEFLSDKEYKVVLKDGIQVEFDGKGNWTEVEAERQSVPDEIVPEAIRTHVKKSFPGNEIVQIARSSRRYEVELTSGLDLEFDKSGKFIRIDN